MRIGSTTVPGWLLWAVVVLSAVPTFAQAPEGGTAIDLSGSWTVTTFGATWTVDLTPAESTAGDTPGPAFCGQAVQKRKDKDGNPYANQLCAVHVADKNTLRISVSQVICEAPFKPDGAMLGVCAISGLKDGPGGNFKASRTPPQKKK